jgi:2-haloacid dehalogenase
MTGYVARPLEHGPDQKPQGIDDGEFDVTATDFLDLADKLIT